VGCAITMSTIAKFAFSVTIGKKSAAGAARF
jgi:hypothetical protein